MEKLVKENIIYLFIIILAIAGGIAGVVYFGSQTKEFLGAVTTKQELLETKQQQLQQAKQQKELQQQRETKKTGSGKVIYEVLGQQFSSEASFGIMFENILSNITNSGLRIRSIDYNYSPAEDKVLQTNAPNYHACELSFVTVSNYSQLQNFFKNLAKEDYLTGINEIYLEPYDKDKSILISRFKIRLYTKTI